MRKKKNTKQNKQDGLGVFGSLRLQIQEKDGTVVGDSGWGNNIITRGGVNFMLGRFINTASSAYAPTRLRLGTGGSPDYTTTGLPGGITSAGALVTFTSGQTLDSNKTQYQTLGLSATWAAGWNDQVYNISNVGLYNSDNDTCYAGKTFASSACATDQQVTITYNILLGGQTGS